MSVMLIDLHVHSSVSDGTTSPTRLVFDAQAAGLDVIGLTDHDTFDGVREATEAGRRVGVTVLQGVEISAERQGSSVHLLGYGCDPRDAALAAELARCRAGRAGRIRATLDLLAELGVPLSHDEVMAQIARRRRWGGPASPAHGGWGYVRDRTEALSSTWPTQAGRQALRPDVAEAIRLVRAAHGLAVLAHLGAGMGRADPADHHRAHRTARPEGLEVVIPTTTTRPQPPERAGSAAPEHHGLARTPRSGQAQESARRASHPSVGLPGDPAPAGRPRWSGSAVTR
jgi:hypothetical protein